MQKAPVKEIPGVTPWHGHVWKCFHSAWQQALQKVKSNSSCSKNKTARNLGVLLSESNCVLATEISKLEASFSQKNSVLFCLNAARWHQFLNLIVVWYLMFFHTSFPSWQVKKWSWVNISFIDLMSDVHQIGHFLHLNSKLATRLGKKRQE